MINKQKTCLFIQIERILRWKMIQKAKIVTVKSLKVKNQTAIVKMIRLLIPNNWTISLDNQSRYKRSNKKDLREENKRY
jgi:hypothetical protein